jgi:hypothetical protein
MLLAAIVASFAIASMAEAAPKKAVRHRARHSSRVSTGNPSTSTQHASGTTKARRHAQANRGAAKKSTTLKAPAKRRPLTKPR